MVTTDGVISLEINSIVLCTAIKGVLELRSLVSQLLSFMSFFQLPFNVKIEGVIRSIHPFNSFFFPQFSYHTSTCRLLLQLSFYLVVNFLIVTMTTLTHDDALGGKDFNMLLEKNRLDSFKNWPFKTGLCIKENVSFDDLSDPMIHWNMSPDDADG